MWVQTNLTPPASTQAGRDIKITHIGRSSFRETMRGYGVIRVPSGYGNISHQPQKLVLVEVRVVGRVLVRTLLRGHGLWRSSSASGSEVSGTALSGMGAGASTLGGFIRFHVFLHFLLHDNVGVTLLRALFSHRNVTDATALHMYGRRAGL